MSRRPSALRRGLGGRLYDACTAGAVQLIGLVSPARALAYARSRRLLSAYAAGTRRGPNRRWRPRNRAEDDNLRRDWRLVTARARDLARNSGNVAGALEKIGNNVVYLGIKPQVQLRDAADRLDTGRNRAVEEAWRRWAEHPRVRFYDIERLVLRHSWVEGECLLHLYASPALHREGVVPLGIELLEPDYLDSSVDGVQENGNRAVRGIEFDAEGFPVAYHIFTAHPGASMDNLRTFGLGQSVRIEAGSIIHPFRPARASQTRGMSWLAAVIMEMHDFSEYQTSERIAARLTSAFGFFVTSAYPEMTAGLLGGFPGSGREAQVPALAEARIPAFVDPGRIQVLPEGTKIQAEGFARPGSNYDPYTKRQLKGASAGMGVSYEAFSNDYADASYSSARSAALEERRGYRVQQEYLVDRLCRPLWRAWTRFSALAGLGDRLGLTRNDLPVSWQTPGWSWVDPRNDAAAAQMRYQLGIASLRGLAGEAGGDLDDIMAQRREELENYGGLIAAGPAGTAAAAKNDKEPGNAAQEG